MDLSKAEQIAAFRFSLIAPIVSRQTPLAPGELKAYLTATTMRTFDLPCSKERVSVRTLERYIAAYRANGWEGLKPKPRPERESTAISVEVLAMAEKLRRERPERSVEQIIFCLEESDLAKPGSIAPSTLARHFKKAGLSRSDLLVNPIQSGTFQRYETDTAHNTWQCDFQHTLYLPDPKDPKRRKKAELLAIVDDYSRALVHCEFYWDEKLPRLEDGLKKAILKHGFPTQFYCDNGAAFSSGHLTRICGKLGIHLSHSRPYRPQGRGKIERLFRFIDTSFLPEVYKLIEEGTITSLAELNTAVTSWVDGYYHQRKHGTTKVTPAERLASASPRKKLPFNELTEIFLWEENRQADKTACVKLQGNLYEIDSELARKKVTLRFDPFDLTEIQVWYNGQRFNNAKPLDMHRSVFDKVAKVATEIKKTEETPSGISLIKLAETKRQEMLSNDVLSFSSPNGEGRGI